MTGGFTWSVVELRLRHVFTIARGSRSVVPTVIVRYARDGFTGLGEASPIARYGESPETVARFLGRVRDLAGGAGADAGGGPGTGEIDAFLDTVDSLEPGNTAAKAAVDIALNDWAAKAEGTPLWKRNGFPRAPLPRSSYTIGIDVPVVVERKVMEAAGFGSLKLKMGVPGEREFVRQVRELTDKPIRIDANEGWKTKEEAIGHLEWLEPFGVELVEQPLPAGNPRDVAWLRGRTGIPLYADEDLLGLAGLAAIADAYDGVNLKLMKCGGLREAVKIAGAVRAKGMKLMIGCMIETSVGTSAAAQLAPIADVLDLDGSLLIDNDPFRGAVGPDGTVRLTDLPGIGVREGGE
jgi:L-alanine-DL-glutamate epimerase-like enolase superfamily enzyme